MPAPRPFTWSRYPELDRPGYEVSSAGDKQYSALFCHIKGKTIEEKYQLDVKGYRGHVPTWRQAKGKPPLLPLSRLELLKQYVDLWRVWAARNHHLVTRLAKLAADRGYHLTDQFATSEVNQAHALSIILNEVINGTYLPLR